MLAALIIEAVVMGMMDVAEMRRLARVQRFDFWVAVAAILGTLAFGVLAGVVIGIALSLLWLVAVTTRPAMPLLGREPGPGVPRARGAPRGRDSSRESRCSGSTEGSSSPPPTPSTTGSATVIGQRRTSTASCSTAPAINFVDSQGAATLSEIIRIAEESGVDLRLAAVVPPYAGCSSGTAWSSGSGPTGSTATSTAP